MAGVREFIVIFTSKYSAVGKAKDLYELDKAMEGTSADSNIASIDMAVLTNSAKFACNCPLYCARATFVCEWLNYLISEVEESSPDGVMLAMMRAAASAHMSHLHKLYGKQAYGLHKSKELARGIMEQSLLYMGHAGLNNPIVYEFVTPEVELLANHILKHGSFTNYWPGGIIPQGN